MPTRSREYSEATEATALALESGGNPEVAEAGLSLSVFHDLKEGFAYLKKQPQVLALGITHATMMAGVVSANVILVALANDVLHAGARGLGYLEGGWAIGAITGGLLASQLNDKLRMSFYVGCIAVLCAGHIVVPFVAFVIGAVTIQAIFGFCRAVSGVVAKIHLNDDRSAPLHGPYPILHRNRHHRPPNPDELRSRLGRATHQPLRRFSSSASCTPAPEPSPPAPAPC